MEDERTLLEKLARGDRASFDALYMRYAAKTEEFLCRKLKNRAEAEDITHDLFLKIWQNRSTMAGVTAFGSYLFRMARNAVYDRFDSRAVRTNFARQTNLLPEYELPDVDNRDLLLLIHLDGKHAAVFALVAEFADGGAEGLMQKGYLGVQNVLDAEQHGQIVAARLELADDAQRLEIESHRHARREQQQIQNPG